MTLSVGEPGGETAPAPIAVRPARDAGHFSGSFTPARPGLYHATVTARRGGDAAGSADRWFHVGDVDREFVDPRLNEGFLRRLARGNSPQPRASAARPVARAVGLHQRDGSPVR